VDSTEDCGIPKVFFCGIEGSYNILIMDLLGKSLEYLFLKNGRRLSLKTILLLGEQMLQRIEFVHRKKFIHRDIKPDNFLMGVG